MLISAVGIVRRRTAWILAVATIAALVLVIGAGSASADLLNPTTTTALSISPMTAAVGQNITFTATVTGSGGNPTGSVEFDANGGSIGSATLSPKPGSATQSVATYSTSGMAAGTYSITATYTSDDDFNYFGSDSGAGQTLMISTTVIHNTALVLTSDPAGSVPFEQSVTFTAHVTETDGGTSIPTGTVSFDDITGGADHPVHLGSTSLDSTGTASLTLTGGFLSGPRQFTASYEGDIIDHSAIGSLSLGVDAGQTTTVDTTTTVTTSPPPITAGDSVILSAHVVQTGTLTSPPQGEIVTFTANGVDPHGAQLDANGNASVTVSGWIAGSYNIQASYVGDTTYKASAGTISLSVSPATSQTVDTLTTVTTSPSHITAGQTVTVTAHVVQTGAPTSPPQGPLVTFTANGNFLGVQALGADGNATITTSSWIEGSYDIKASYAGDILDNGSFGNVPLTVDPARTGPPPALTVAGPNASMTYGDSLPALAPSYSGFTNSDTDASLSLPATCTTGATSGSPVGTYAVTCAGASDVNYTIVYTAGSVTINQAGPVTVAAPSASMVTGGAVPALSPSYSGFVNGESAASLTSPATCTTTATSSSLPGTYAVTCSDAVDGNYTFTYTAGSLTVNPLGSLTVTAPSPSMIAGGAVPALVPSYSGFVGTDTIASLASPATCTTTATSSSLPGTYTVTCSGAVDPSYSISYVAGTLTVNPATRPTTLTYTGDRKGEVTDPAVLSATLLNSVGAPISGGHVVFSLGTQSCAADTNAAGKASCILVVTQTAGTYPVSANYAGSTTNMASSASASFIASAEDTSIYVAAPSSAAAGSTVTLSAWLAQDILLPVAGKTVTLSFGSQHCTAVTNVLGIAKCTIVVGSTLGPVTTKASFAGDSSNLAASATGSSLVYAWAPGGGSFVVGDQSDTGAVTFWGSKWSKENDVSHGSAPSSFKGYALNPSTPGCGSAWKTDPGNSSPPPNGPLPAYMAVIVSSSISKSGSTISGDTVQIVIVKTNAGYDSNPGHAGTGTVVATVDCSGSSGRYNNGNNGGGGGSGSGNGNGNGSGNGYDTGHDDWGKDASKSHDH